MDTFVDNIIADSDFFRRIALKSDDGVTVSYGDIVSMVDMFRQYIREKALLFCMCENSPGAVIGYVSAIENKVVPLLLDAGMAKEKFLAYYETYEPAYVWAPEYWEHADCFKQGRRLLGAYGYVLWELPAPECKLHKDLALLLTTSGSTGDPKLVRLSYDNINSNAAAIVEYLGITAKERPITTLPMHYTYGLSVINSHLMVGATILMTKASYVQSEFWDFLEREQATSIAGVPYTFEILKRLRIFRKPLPSIRTITQAGGHLSPQMQQVVGEWAKAQQAKFYVMYGQTEATARMSYLPAENALTKLGSIGIPIPGGAFSIQDEELIYTGKNVSMGYAVCREDLSLGDERHGVLATGDLARQDEDGYYYIIGRKKRFVKIYGNRVSLDACEDYLKTKFLDGTFACTGVDDHLNVYVAGTDAEKAAVALADYLGLNRKSIEGIEVSAIPKNSAGKTLYQELEK